MRRNLGVGNLLSLPPFEKGGPGLRIHGAGMNALNYHAQESRSWQSATDIPELKPVLEMVKNIVEQGLEGASW